MKMAHQWWAHQVIGANMQGQAMLSESLVAVLRIDGHGEGIRAARRCASS